MKRFEDDDVVDVVVVGTGAGAGPLLATLAGAGLSVVALEAGAAKAPGDHTPDETTAVDLNWMDERLSGGTDPTAFGLNNSGRGVGGSMLHWGAFTPRPDARDLQLRTLTGEGADWPIGDAELTAYVERVEAFIGVSGPTPYPWDPQRRYPLPPLRRNASAEAVVRGCDALGITATDAPAAVVSREWQQPAYGLRQACVNAGSCHQGCRNAAKAGTEVTYLPLAVVRGAEIRPDSTVTGIETDLGAQGRGRVTGVVYVHEGRERRQRCARLVLAAGGVETPRLLLHTGLANASGQVGRSFMAHGAVQVWGRFTDEMRAYRGYPSAIISEDFVRATDADFAGGYLVQSLGVQPVTFATTLTRGGGLWGPELVEAMDDYRYLAGVGINAECLPYDDNRVVLADETDGLGVPRARITFSAGANEQAIEAHATRTLTDVMTAAGARSTRVLPRTAHTVGTCRMGTDPDTSVVDPTGRSHEVDGLWVCDNSVFPSSLTANPALTIMALSLRTAERMLRA